MPKDLIYWLRWFIVLPGAIIFGLMSTFPLRLFLYNTLSNFVEPYPKLPELLLTPFVIAASFIYGGSMIAPNHKKKTSYALFSIWFLFYGYFIILSITGNTWFNLQPTIGITSVMGVAGAITGIYLVRRYLK